MRNTCSLSDTVDYGTISTKKTFTQQFSQIYFCRLKALLPSLKGAAIEKWCGDERSDKPILVDRILDSAENADSILFGVMFAELSNKPNILRDLEGDLSFPELSLPNSYFGDNSKFFLEDESGRVEIAISDKVAASFPYLLLTGICIALRGMEDQGGKFVVTDYCFPKLLNVPTRNVREPKQIALISGLEFGGERQNNLAMETLFDFLTGNLPPSASINASSIVHAVFVGNSLTNPTRIDESNKKKYGNEGAKYNVQPILEFDQKIALLTRSVSVSIVPGSSDPTNLALPQAAIKPGLFPNSSLNSSLNLLSNPVSFKVDDIQFLVSSGQNIEDMARYFSSPPDHLSLAELNLVSRHIAPTAPDTLWCYPFFDKDPFIIENPPHCYVVGNQSKFETKTLSNGQVVILLPQFHATNTIVLLNTVDLSLQTIKLAI